MAARMLFADETRDFLRRVREMEERRNTLTPEQVRRGEEFLANWRKSQARERARIDWYSTHDSSAGPWPGDM